MKEQSTKILKVAELSVREVKSILYWNHKRGGQAHCLVRLFVWLALPKVVVVVSELASNPIGLEITNDFTGIVEALSQQFQVDIGSKLNNVVWIVHHGRFSFIEALNQEVFMKVNLKWEEQSAECDLSDWHILDSSQIQTLLDGIQLEPVQEALKDLDWT